MEKIIKLIAASAADDILCADGELLDAGFLFDTTDGDADNPSAPGSHGSEPWQPVVAIDSTVFSPPSGATFLGLHTPPGSSQTFAIVRASGGTIQFASDASGAVWSTLVASLSGLVKMLPVGQFLVFLTGTGLFYARFSGGSYVWLGAAPVRPQSGLSASPKALPPYCYSDGALPEIGVHISIKNDSDSDVTDWLAGRSSGCSVATMDAVVSAVSERFADFLRAVSAAGLHFSPVRATVCRELPDGTLWQAGDISEVASGASDVVLKIVGATCRDGELFMTLQVSRAPFAVSASATAALSSGWQDAVGNGWCLRVLSETNNLNAGYISSPFWIDGASRGFAVGVFPKTDGGAENSGDILDEISIHGTPDDIFSIGGRLLAVYNQSAKRVSNQIATSMEGLPLVCTGIGKVAGGRILGVSHSLRSLSSGQFGEFPVYAFCADGMRALTPSEGSFRDVQLISRDVPLNADAFAPLPDATAFVSEAGVMKIEGTSVSNLSAKAGIGISSSSRLVYVYGHNCLVLYTPGVTACNVYDTIASKWHDGESRITAVRYGWPQAWIQYGAAIGKARVSNAAEGMFRQAERSGLQPIAVTTRPIKLGNPFAVKKLEEVEAVWPDGNHLPLKVYGAMRLDKWYFLGLARAGRMCMRGSGWRFFRVETFVVPTGYSYLIPTLRLRYA